MNRTLLAPLTFLLAAAPLLAEPPVFKPIVEKIDLKDGDTLVFLGDSITHQCLYTQYVEDYYYTRYPKLRLHFHNSGVGGDRAQDAITRFDEDVAAYKPKYVTILLGMNDGAYRDFDKQVFDTYQKGMVTLLDGIAGIGATAIPMTPTMFDTRAKRLKNDNGEPRNTYYNGVLSLYGTWLREQAEVRGLGFVDMWSPLNNLTIEKRKKDPNFTMIGDGVHPGPVGQAVMAAAIINDMVPRSAVSEILIFERDGQRFIGPTNGSVTQFNGTTGGDTIAFTFTADALPWVLPPEAAEGATLTHLGHKFSNEKVTVRNLKPGNYELKIDGQPVGAFTDAQLAAGVEIEGNDKTPEYQQALQVAMLNTKRNDEAYRPIRDQYGQLKGQRREIEKATQASDPQLEAKKAAFDQWYAAMKAKVAELGATAKSYEDQIYAANQPKPHKYELAPVK